MTFKMDVGFQIPNGFAPAWAKGKGGPKTVPVEFDFSTGASNEIDLLKLLDANQIDYVQSMYVDNNDNANAITFNWDVTRHRVIVPAFSQGVFPIITPRQNPHCVVSTPETRDLVIRAHLLNIPMPFMVWGPAPTVTVNSAPNRGVFTDYSGTIAAGGVSQQVIAANPTRSGLLIQAPSTNPESIFINWGAAAAAGSSLELLPSGSYWADAAMVSTQSINIVAATLGTAYVCKEFN